MNLAPAVRSHVADLLEEVGPDAPTMCDGWTARDLAAHLVIRDRRPDAMPGILIPAFAGYTEKVQNARAGNDYPQLVQDVRTGPGSFSPMKFSPIDERVNLMEYVTHAEDVRRAQSEAVAAGLPPLPTGTDVAIWKKITPMGKFLVRSSPVGVTASAAGFGESVLKPQTANGSVTLVGNPIGLLMHLSGRRDCSGVAVEGSPEAIDTFAAIKLGL